MAPFFSFPAAFGLSALVAAEPRQLGFVGGKLTYSGTEADRLNSLADAVQAPSSSEANPFANFAAAVGRTDKSYVRSSNNFGLNGPALNPETGSSIMEGLISSFLAGRPLAPGEEQCLQEGSGALGGQVAEISQNIVVLGEAVMNQNKLGKSDASPATRRPETEVAARLLQATSASTDAGMMLNGAASVLELGSEIKKIGNLGHQILSKCLQSDGKDTLKQAAENAESFQYLRKTMASSGPVMMTELSEALDAWHNNRPAQFGASVGTALRIVFLTEDTSGALPEGLPNKATLANVTSGFLQGFFGPGMEVTIETPETGSKPISIDLSKCVGDNARLLENMWASTIRLHAKQSGSSDNMFTQSVHPSYPELLAYSLMRAAEALKQCNIGKKQEQELEDAVASMGQGVHLDFQAPAADMSKSQALSSMGSTMGDYKQMVSDPSLGGLFGQKLGSFMQGALGTAMSKKYAVDEHGNLMEREIADLSDSNILYSTRSSHVLVPSLLALMFTLLLLAAVKLGRARVRGTVPEEDLEACAPAGNLIECDAIE